MSLPDNHTKFLKFNLEVIIALMAVFVSIGSFYATYIQAQAAEKQVMAMTLPMLNYGHSNFSSLEQRSKVSLSINNVGVGPAKIEQAFIVYKGEKLNKKNGLSAFIDSCCKEEHAALMSTLDEGQLSRVMTAPVENTILANDDSVSFLSLNLNMKNKVLWNKLNIERWNTHVEVCFCSLIDNCYWLKQNNSISKADSCASTEQYQSSQFL